MNAENGHCALNTDPPLTRCGMCGGRCKWTDGGYWITCRRCIWSSHDPERVGWRWRLRVLLGSRPAEGKP